MSLSCIETRDLLPLFPDDLDPSEAAKVREHVATCNGCAVELGIFASQAARFATLRQGREKVDLFAGIAERLARPAPVVAFPRRFGVVAAAAAAAVVLAFGLLSQARGPIEPIAPADGIARGQTPPAPRPTVAPHEVAITHVAPQQHRARRAPIQLFESDGATPAVSFATERELVPLDEEADIPQTKKSTFAEPQAAHPTSPSGSGSGSRSADDDRSLSF
jgi:hypothetical protein